MDYKEKYKETIEQLFFATRELEEHKRSEELNYHLTTAVRLSAPRTIQFGLQRRMHT